MKRTPSWRARIATIALAAACSSATPAATPTATQSIQPAATEVPTARSETTASATARSPARSAVPIDLPTPAATPSATPNVLPSPSTTSPGEPASATVPADAAAAADAARRHLAADLGITLDSLMVVHVEPVDWPTSALGCSQPGRVYLQVITPGYRVRLEHAPNRYEVHTDRVGSVVVRC